MEVVYCCTTRGCKFEAWLRTSVTTFQAVMKSHFKDQPGHTLMVYCP